MYFPAALLLGLGIFMIVIGCITACVRWSFDYDVGETPWFLIAIGIIIYIVATIVQAAMVV